MLLVCRIAGMAVCPPIAHDNRRSENSSYAEGSCRTGRPPQACWPTSGHEAEQAEALAAQRHAVDVLPIQSCVPPIPGAVARIPSSRTTRGGLIGHAPPAGPRSSLPVDQAVKRPYGALLVIAIVASRPGHMAVASRAHQLVWPPSCSLVPKVGPRPHLVDTRHRWRGSRRSMVGSSRPYRAAAMAAALQWLARTSTAHSDWNVAQTLTIERRFRSKLK